MSMIGELLLCLSLAAILTLPLWADDPSEVARMGREKEREGA